MQTNSHVNATILAAGVRLDGASKLQNWRLTAIGRSALEHPLRRPWWAGALLSVQERLWFALVDGNRIRAGATRGFIHHFEEELQMGQHYGQDLRVRAVEDAATT